MATTLAPSTMDLKDFFSAAEGRIEQWRQLQVTARGWEADVAHGRGAERGHADAARLLDDIGPPEEYWAYPGPHPMATLDQALRGRNAAGLDRLRQKIRIAMS